MTDTTLSVAIDARPAEVGARRLERILSGVRRNIDSTSRETRRFSADAASAGNALVQVANDARQAEIAYGKLLRKSLEMGQPFARGTNSFVTGASAHARVVNAVASGSGQNGEFGGVIQAGGVPYLIPFGNGGGSAGPGGSTGLLGRSLRWIGGRLTSLPGIVATYVPEVMEARRDIASVNPRFPLNVEHHLHRVANATGTDFTEIAPLYAELGRVPGFAEIESQAPQLIEDLLNLNRLNGLSGREQATQVQRFFTNSSVSLAGGVPAFSELVAGAGAMDSGLKQKLSDILSDLSNPDFSLADFTARLSSQRDRINDLADEVQPGLLGQADEVWSRIQNFVREHPAGLAASATEAAIDGVRSPFYPDEFPPFVPPPRPELPPPSGPLASLNAYLAPLDDLMRARDVQIPDLAEVIGPVEPISVPLDLQPFDVDDFPDLQRAADRIAGDLQHDFDTQLTEYIRHLNAGNSNEANDAAQRLEDAIASSTNLLEQNLVPVPSMDGYPDVLNIAEKRTAIAEEFVEDWIRAYLEARTEGFGAPGEELLEPLAPMPDSGRFKRQGSRDGIDLGYRDVGQSMLDGQLASSVVTADMLPVGRPEAVVPTSEEIELLMARSEALRAQSGVLDEGFTPATKGAAEATMELADAAVGLDAAFKAPDPAAMAEEMEELSALGQQVGNSFASAFERAVFSGEELSDVLSALALDLARLVLQQQVLGPLAGGIGGLFDDIIGGLFGVTGVGSSVGGVTQGGSTSLHTGGLVEHGAPLSRAIAPSVWLGASRYHFGGLAGDEVPAILRRGEEVLTRDDPRHRANGGLGGGRAGGEVVNVNTHVVIEGGAVNNNGLGPEAEAAVGRQIDRAVSAAVDRRIARQMRVGGMLNRVA